ncbi:hypothetical protein B879_02132 [Cecembia lonarensis LW9]|uniref:Uncharacterized protein n=1 Tax=Cecembia lonarensis (strain CCUG 58316 / KCTC 22772 / LW9) TaxID=1225176 RepID=K1L3B2_CECL9|nr:hypothetical protein B879_02132 [Cecembia lonarensis LW9]
MYFEMLLSMKKINYNQLTPKFDSRSNYLRIKFGACLLFLILEKN